MIGYDSVDSVEVEDDGKDSHVETGRENFSIGRTNTLYSTLGQKTLATGNLSTMLSSNINSNSAAIEAAAQEITAAFKCKLLLYDVISEAPCV